MNNNNLMQNRGKHARVEMKLCAVQWNLLWKNGYEFLESNNFVLKSGHHFTKPLGGRLACNLA